MYSLLGHDLIRINEAQIRRQIAHEHERVALRRARRASSEPTGLTGLWLTVAGSVRRDRSAKPANACRPA
jgi:hypothetical protein